MQNRNAEALFWIGRYMERAENHARLIDVHYHLQQEGDEVSEEAKWSRLIDALGAREEYLRHYETFNEEDVLYFLTLDLRHVNSLYSCVHQARSNMRRLRQQLPSELWDVVSSFDLWLSEQQVSDILNQPHAFYSHIKEASATFLGAEQSVMPRENEWHFVESGRFLERAENTVRIILQAVTIAMLKAPTAVYSILQAVLKSVSGYQAFRRIYADGLSANAIMEFLISNASFPRSVSFAFHALESHPCALEVKAGEKLPGREKVIRQTSKIRAELDYLEGEELSIDEAVQLLESLMEACEKVGKVMDGAFFRCKGEAV